MSVTKVGEVTANEPKQYLDVVLDSRGGGPVCKTARVIGEDDQMPEILVFTGAQADKLMSSMKDTKVPWWVVAVDMGCPEEEEFRYGIRACWIGGMGWLREDGSVR